MPRGKRTVLAMFCSETGVRLGTVKWNPRGEKSKDDLSKAIGTKYNPKLKKRVAVKLKEEKK